jgi:hypothetical protein
MITPEQGSSTPNEFLLFRNNRCCDTRCSFWFARGSGTYIIGDEITERPQPQSIVPIISRLALAYAILSTFTDRLFRTVKDVEAQTLTTLAVDKGLRRLNPAYTK